MKKIIAMLLAVVLCFGLVACGGEKPAEGGEVAVFWYTFGDTYLSSVRAAMNEAFNAAGVKYLDYDANNNQTTQTEQIQTAITKGASALVVNIVDASSDDATQAILDMAKNANLPIVFFNRSVSEAIVSSYDKAAYVGTDYTMAGHMQGKMIGEYVLANYDALDINGDGETGDINTHRIIGKRVTDGGIVYFETQGDAELYKDDYELHFADVIAVYNGHSRLRGMGAVADFLKSSVGFLLVVVLPMALFFLYELYNLLKIIMEQKMQKAAATASATVSAETEEEIKRRAIEEFLAQQAAENAEKPADSDEE